VIREDHRVPIGAVLDDADAALAVTLVAPGAGQLADPPVVFSCVPGGGLDRGYYDLRTGEGERFSFAVQMARHGFITIAIDPLGIGGSTRPARGFDLTADMHAQSLARLHSTVCAGLREGQFTSSLPALPDTVSIGVGHSAGALLTVFQQAAHGSFDGLVLLGFGTGGLPAVLDDEMRACANDPAAARANAVRLARRWFADPFPALDAAGRGREIYGGGADPQALQAMHACRASLLATVAAFVVIPGSSAPEAARIDVPLLLVAGDRDLCGAVDTLAASFGGSPAVSVLELVETGHSHFAFASVDVLFPRIAAWAQALAAAPAAPAALEAHA
jgi:pimeloyl-ACP methyl ester carboxylesterase